MASGLRSSPSAVSGVLVPKRNACAAGGNLHTRGSRVATEEPNCEDCASGSGFSVLRSSLAATSRSMRRFRGDTARRKMLHTHKKPTANDGANTHQ